MSEFEEDVPLEVRRKLWGWFGEPWPSGICLKVDPETGQDLEPPEWNFEMQVATPVGVPCIDCGLLIALGDQGVYIPLIRRLAPPLPQPRHIRCMISAVLG